MFVSTIIFALNIPVAKSLLTVWHSPLGLTGMRIVFAAAMFWLVSLFIKKEKVTSKDMVLLIFGSFFGMAFNQMSFISGLSMTSPIDASIIATTTPMIVMLISAAVLKEPITVKKTLGVIIGAAGAILIVVSQTHNSMNPSSWIGNLLVLVSSSMYAVYLVITKKITQRYHPVTLLKWMFLFAAIFVLPFTYSEIMTFPLLHVYNPDVAIRIFYILFMATFISYFLIPISLKRIRPTSVGSYNYLQPLIASFAAIAVGQDTLTIEKPIAAILVFSGVYLVTISKSRADLEKENSAK